MVREYEPKDLEGIVALFRRSVREVACRDYSPIQTSVWAPEHPDLLAWSERLSNGAVFVCERNGAIAGFVRIDWDGYIDLLYVHPDFQRQGVARELMARIYSWAWDQGIRHLYSKVSLTARPFFEHQGFRIIRQQVVERRGVSFINFRMEADILGDAPQAARPSNSAFDFRETDRIRLRAATKHDAEALFEIRCSVTENYQSRAELATLGITVESVIKMIEGGDYVTTIAEVRDQPVGFTMAQISEGYVFAAFVRPSFEAQGIGKALMSAAEKGLRRAGVKEAWLSTGSDSNLRAVGFYRHLGWRETGYLDDGQVIFKKTL